MDAIYLIATSPQFPVGSYLIDVPYFCDCPATSSIIRFPDLDGEGRARCQTSPFVLFDREPIDMLLLEYEIAERVENRSASVELDAAHMMRPVDKDQARAMVDRLMSELPQ